jgi:hypothetical protein
MPGAVRRLLSAMRGLIADRKPNWWASGGVASAERQKTWRCQARQACCLQPHRDDFPAAYGLGNHSLISSGAHLVVVDDVLFTPYHHACSTNSDYGRPASVKLVV